MSISMLSSTIVSQWTWAASLLQSTSVGTNVKAYFTFFNIYKLFNAYKITQLLLNQVRTQWFVLVRFRCVHSNPAILNCLHGDANQGAGRSHFPSNHPSALRPQNSHLVRYIRPSD
jgi:hypothetical protein